MRFVPACAVVVALSALWLGAPTRVFAWRSSSVRSVSAHLVVAPDASAQITVVATVRVDRGWLEGFEIDGLDPELQLDPERPATFESALGERFAPTVEHRGDGRVVWSFRRRGAPQRGDYTAAVTYRSRLATEVDGGGVRVLWTLPAWRFGLDDVAITIDAPAGAEAVLGEDDEGSVIATRMPGERGERVVLRRAHLPRTREWPIAIVVPAAGMDGALLAPRVVAAPPAPVRAETSTEGPAVTRALVIALALLGWIAIAIAARASTRARVLPAPLVPLPAWARAVAIGGCAIAASVDLGGGAGWLGIDAPLLASLVIAVLAIERRASLPRAPRLGAFRPATKQDLRAARRDRVVALLSPFHGSAVAGGAAAVAIAAGILALPAGAIAIERAALVGACAIAIVLAAARATRPGSGLADLATLASLARRARADLGDERERRWALRLVVHADVRGVLQDARLRIALPAAPRGLLRLDVVRVWSAERARWTSEPALLVVTREGSPADRALEDRFPGAAIDRAPRRVARQLPMRSDLACALVPVLETLAACPVEQPLAREATSAADLAASA